MRKSPIVHIQCLDHAMNSGASPSHSVLDVVGFLIKQDKLCYYVANVVADGEINNDTEWMVVLKSTVTKIRRVR